MIHSPSGGVPDAAPAGPTPEATKSATTDAIRLQLRSWPEVEAYLQTCKGVIVPLGSTEQHGPTGAIGTDALTAEAVALEVGRRTGVLVTPAQAFGMAEHHLGFAGTVSLQPSTLLAVLHDVVLSTKLIQLAMQHGPHRHCCFNPRQA